MVSKQKIRLDTRAFLVPLLISAFNLHSRISKLHLRFGVPFSLSTRPKILSPWEGGADNIIAAMARDRGNSNTYSMSRVSLLFEYPCLRSPFSSHLEAINIPNL